MMGELSAAVLTGSPLFVEAIAPLLAEHAGVRLNDPNALFGAGAVDAMTVTISVSLTPYQNPAVADSARMNGLGEVLAAPIETHSSALIVEVGAIVDPFAGQELMSRILGLLARLDGVLALYLHWQSLTTTPALYLHDLSAGEGTSALTWFSVIAVWRDDAKTSSLAVTRGLPALGMPNVQLDGPPWEPVQARNALRSVVASALKSRMPLQPGVGFDLAPGVPVVLQDGTDVLSQDPVLNVTVAG